MGDALPSVDLGTGRSVIAIAAGAYHACAMLDTRQVKCWGWNAWAPLGLGDTNHRGDQPGEMGNALPTVDLGVGRSAKTIAAGLDQSCAMLDTDQMKCWGWNKYGQLGLGDTNDRGDVPGEMGDALHPVDVGR
jgi:alpha-tubulin suppressor-like RCC1 family protein